MNSVADQKLDQSQLDDLVAQSDTGARNPKGLQGRILMLVALSWSLFQIYYASPIAFWLNDLFGINVTLDDTRARSIHFAFAMFLAFTAYPAYLHKLLPLKRVTALLFFTAGILLTYFEIQSYREITDLLQAQSLVHDKSLTLFLAYIGLVCIVIGNPVIYRHWTGANPFLGTIAFLVGLGALGFWLTDMVGLEALVIESGTNVRAFQTNAGLAAMGLTFLLLAYPAFENSSKYKISLPDWMLSLLAVFVAMYTVIYYSELILRPGDPSTLDIMASMVGVACMLEATRRSLGPPLVLVAVIFLAYTFLAPYLPELISNKSYSVHRVASQQWLSTEGIFGIALSVSTKFVFLFVLFGALLEKAGAGNFFIKIAISLLGHLRGGPAKAAVAASGMTGLISGSSIANVVTTGTFTVPLMKRVGFSAEKAGAVEVSSSVNGQLMPPVMGAAAFLMIEYVGITYVEVVKHAFLPAIISYIALLYIVHLEALKENMQAIPKQQPAFHLRLVRYGLITASFFIVAGLAYGAFLLVGEYLPDYGYIVLFSSFIIAYLLSVFQASRYPDLEMDDPNTPITELPDFKTVINSGLHYFVPIVILIWALMYEKMSPGRSAFWAIFAMIITIMTEDLLIAFFRKTKNYKEAFKKSTDKLLDGLISGSRNMIGIGVATAAAGVVVGTVSLTGIANQLTNIIEVISGGNLLLILFFTALVSLILGLGLPTTANYIVVSTLMAPVIQVLAAQNGLIVPLIAIHLFVFYFGIMADVTPPVGLASFAASAVSGADPIKTGFTAFYYSLRTVALPFVFIFNTQLLLIGIDSIFELIMIVVSSTVAILVFAAGTQGYFIIKNRFYESMMLILIAFTFFRPGFWMNYYIPEFEQVNSTELFSIAEKAEDDGKIRAVVEGYNFAGEKKQTTIIIPFDKKNNKNGKELSGQARIEKFGLFLSPIDNQLVVDRVEFGSEAEKLGIDFDWRLLYLEKPSARPPKELFFIPATLLLFFIIYLQRRRRDEINLEATQNV